MIKEGSLCVERLREANMRTNVPLYTHDTEMEHVPVNMDHEITSEVRAWDGQGLLEAGVMWLCG